MGSSVFHGGFSTFLAICALGGSVSYIFVVFFRLWLGIIFFGMANGFLLLPIILSLCGPLNEPTNNDPANEKSTPQESGKDIELAKEKESPNNYNTEQALAA